MKKIITIRGSHRKDGNTNLVTDTFIENFLTKDCIVENIYLCDMNIEFYNPINEYSKNDEFEIIEDALFSADLIVLSTPMYWYSVTGRMKNFFDRFNGIYVNGNIERLIDKKVVLIYTYSGNPYPEFIFPIKDTVQYLKMEFLDSFSIRTSMSLGILSDDLERIKEFSNKILFHCTGKHYS